MAETPEQKYNRIAAAVHQTILQNFPNPDRVGCPGDARLREVAARRTIIEDDDWQHITHCSPCYAEFLDAKEQIRRSGRRARTLGLIAGTTVLILLAGAVGYRYLAQSGSSDQVITAAFEPATLDLKDSSGTRGDEKALQKAVPVLPRRPLELTIILPFGSEAGTYQFQFVDAEGHVLKSGEATAAVSNGSTALKTKLDTSNLAAGDYRIGLRQQSFNWIIYSLRLR
jgi:hypothetical protein